MDNPTSDGRWRRPEPPGSGTDANGLLAHPSEPGPQRDSQPQAGRPAYDGREQAGAPARPAGQASMAPGSVPSETSVRWGQRFPGHERELHALRRWLDGRGLLMVRELSVRCGARGDARGRVVWADITWDGPPVSAPTAQELAGLLTRLRTPRTSPSGRCQPLR